MKKITRRQTLIGAAVSGSLLTTNAWASKVQEALNSELSRDTFPFGIASGDPTNSSIVLWTKINLNTQEDQVKLNWELATDSEFENIIQHGKVKTSEKNDFTVKVLVEDLAPGVQYFYRFHYNKVTSEPGRTRTLPSGSLDSLGLAVVSCSNYPFGHFNAYEAIAKDDSIDFVIHLGDYIYEYGHDGYGGKTGKEINREHIPAHEIISLKDYRLRHAQYKSDECSRMMHASHPLIAIWDDHESTNNPYMQGAENHQDNEGDWQQRKQASLQAYYEWMPILKPKEPEKLWRHFEFGDLASLTTLETRHTGRSKQIDYAEHLPEMQSMAQRDNFMATVLGDPNRTMLSKEMDAFLESSLQKSNKSKTKWKLIGNQIPMARTHVPKIDENMLRELNIDSSHPMYEHVLTFQKLGSLNLPIYTDTWDGYPTAREKFYETCRNAHSEDLLVLTGDSHAFWLNELYDNNKNSMGIEIGTTAVTSPGDFESFGSETAKTLDTLMAKENDEIVWTDNLSKGYVRLKLDKFKTKVEFIAVSNILSRSYETKTVKRTAITRNKLNGKLLRSDFF